jgi:hypothetical protein
MPSTLRLSLWAAAAAVFATLAGTLVAVRGESLGHEVVLLLAEQDRSDALDAEVAANDHQRRETQELIDELIDGRLSLAGAAEALHQIELDSHGDFRLIRHAYRGLPEEEAAYCHALHWALRRLPCDPAAAGRVRDRLRAEFAAHFHHLPPARQPA